MLKQKTWLGIFFDMIFNHVVAQWNDILGVLKVQKNLLDMKYVKYWASELGVTDLLKQVLSDAGIS